MNWCAGFRMTRHAEQRRSEMGVPLSELAEVLRNPENIYTQQNYGKDQQVYQRGRVSAVVADGQAVVTVLWRTTEKYARPEKAAQA